MKKLIVSLLMVAGVSVALAQGTVTFSTFNANATLGTVFLPDGTTGAGSAYVGQLWWSDTVGGVYTPISGSTTAFSDGAPGYLAGGSQAVPGHDAGVAVFFEMYVWNSAAGADWATAQSSPALLAFGTSAAKSRILGGIDTDGNIFAPPFYNNFANLTLTAVPEPTTIALAGLGIGALLAFRRRS